MTGVTQRGRDHHAGRHPVGRLRARVLVGGDRRAAQRAVRLPGRQVSGEELAERACTIEIERCGKPIGKQDQYIAAFGGIRDIRFGPGDEVVAEELGLRRADRRALQQQIMLFYTGITRSANPILAEQTANVEATRPQLDLLRDLAGFAAERLRER